MPKVWIVHVYLIHVKNIKSASFFHERNHERLGQRNWLGRLQRIFA